MGRICVTIPNDIEEIITEEAGDQSRGKSEWVTNAIEGFLISRDQKADQVYADLQKKYDDLQERYQSLSAKNSELNSYLRRAHQSLEEHKQLLAESQKVNVNLENKVSALEQAHLDSQSITKALDEYQRNVDLLQHKIKDLEKSLSDKQQDLEWSRGQLVETQRNLSAALERIPATPMITDGQHKPWWQFWKSSGDA